MISPLHRYKAWYFSFFVTFGVVLPYLQLYYRHIGLSLAEIGLLAMLPPIGGLLFSPLFGMLADRLHDVRRLMAFQMICGAAAFLSLLTCDGFASCAVRVFLFAALYAPLTPMADSITVHQAPGLGTDYGKIRIWGSIGFITPGLILGLFLGQRASFGLIFGAFTAGALLTLVATLSLPRMQVRYERSFTFDGARRLLQPNVAVFTISAYLAAAAMGAYYGYFSIYLREEIRLADRWTGVVWAIGPVAEVTVLFYAVPIIRRIGLKAAFMVSLAGVALRMGILAATPPLPVLLLSQMLHALTYGGIHSCGVVYMDRIAPPQSRAGTQGSYAALSFSAGSITGYVLWGQIGRMYDGTVPIFCGATLVALCGVVLCATLFREPEFGSNAGKTDEHKERETPDGLPETAI